MNHERIELNGGQIERLCDWRRNHVEIENRKEKK